VKVTNVAVLGNGPAGMAAAHAATLTGARVHVYAPPGVSNISGAQYLHHPLPTINPDQPDGYIQYVFWGQEEFYKNKVYGNDDVESSWGKFGNEVPYWSMQATYLRMLQIYEDRLVGIPVLNGEMAINVVGALAATHDVLISTIPLPVICTQPEAHTFGNAFTWVASRCPFPLPMQRDTIVYNGMVQDRWSRYSNIMGHDQLEWPAMPEDGPAHRLVKPTTTDCDCWPEVIKAGRYGAWRKEALVDQVFSEVTQLLVQQGVTS
jgi:hypothetical protein